MVKDKSKYRVVRVLLIIFTLLSIPALSYSLDKRQALSEYLFQKGLCSYGDALNILEDWTVNSEDPVVIETNIFRIEEIIKYPELIGRGIEALNSVRAKNRLVRENRFLTARIDFFLNGLYMRLGNTEMAGRIRDSLGFIKGYRIIGPFRSGSEGGFEIQNPPEFENKSGAAYPGKIFNVSWFKAGCGLSGMIDLGDFFKDIGDSLFYLLSGFSISEAGEYILSVGKTGFTDIFIDGRMIFSSRNRHLFCFDQYRIRVRLSGGAHTLLVKSDDSPHGGLKVSVRLTDTGGNPVESGSGSDTAAATAEAVSSAYFDALDTVVKAAPESADPFTSGYLFYISGLDSEEDREALGLLSAVKSGDVCAAAAEYYMGLIERGDEKKDNHFNESIKNSPKNIESIAEAAGIKIKNNFFYEAAPLAESIKKIKPQSVEYLVLEANILASLGWRDAALKAAEKIKETEYPSRGYALEAGTNMRDKRYGESLRGYLYLYAGDRSNPALVDKIVSCYEESGDYRGAENTLTAALLVFPNSVRIRLRLAGLKSDYCSPGEALPYLAAAAGVSPYNGDTLFDTGMAYHKLGRKELAVNYFRRALNYDPDNFELKRFLEIITGVKNEVDEYLIRDDPRRLSGEALAYRNEPAVILLDETAFRILPDGSYDRSVHRIIEINDRNAAKDFSSQYVVINPDTDRIEDFRCAVLNNGERVETSDAERQSLSEPESRLYYDLQASVISLPSIQKGSIIDIRYTVKNRSGAIYKNYFGEKITAGGEYRTMISNTVISFPGEKRIYYHLKDIGSGCAKAFSAGGKRLYRILVRDIPPHKNEPAMPDSSELLPSIYFSSFKNWDEVHMWYSGLIRGRAKLGGEMMMSLKELVKPGDSELDKVKKIYNHVNRLIRYVGFEFGIGGIQPRRAELTYHTRMGDCKDIALVLAAMLREAGIDARLALLRVRDSGEANLAVPFLGEFNHAICYVNAAGGFFIDGTAKMGGFREFPGQDCGVKALVLDESGYSFINTDTGFYLENTESEKTEVSIDEAGRASLSRTITKTGNLADSLRSASLDSEGWNQRMREYWNKRFPGSRIDNLKMLNSAFDEPVSYSYKIDIPSFVKMDGDEAIFASFFVTSDYYKNYAMLKARKYPISLSQKYSVEAVIRYEIPAGFEVFKIPENEKFDHPRFSTVFKFSRSADGRFVDARSEVRFKDYRIDAADYGAFRDFTRIIEKKEKEKIILIRSVK